MRGRTQLTREAGETLAIQALAFLADEPERLAGFLTNTGISGDQIRESAQEPGFLAGVLDHILSDENLLIVFVESAGIDPADIARARRALGGHWERDVP